MEVEEFMKTFDRCWFESNIFNTRMSISLETASKGYRGEPEENLSHMLSRAPTVLVRSMSDQLDSQMSFSTAGSVSPDSVLRGPKLRSIPSGKEAGVYEEEELEGVKDAVSRRRLVRRRGTRTTSKSLSKLEFEEVKGFMDLGFVFSEEDKDSSLAEIIPGLHRLGGSNTDADEDHPVSRPYLSESWEWWDRQRKEEERRRRSRTLLNWDVPASGDESDIKRSLRLWAHDVAFKVR